MKKRDYKIMLMMLVLFLAPFQVSLLAQQKLDSNSITGIVMDEFGSPIAGVVIQDENRISIGSTDNKGEFIVSIDKTKSLTFYSIGYRNLKISLDNERSLKVEMKTDVHRKDEIIDLGYTTQRRNTISGAVSIVSGAELEKVPTANFSQTLAGNLLGLSTMEVGSNLGNAVVSKFSRGISSINGNQQPVVIVDGVLLQTNDYEYITAKEIESITLLKDASTTALYGSQGSNGVIAITTKTGRPGVLNISTSIDQSFQAMDRKPLKLSSWEYAMLRNEAWKNDGSIGTIPFTDEQVQKYKIGNDALYPNNNYYDKFLSKFASMQRIGINVSGGSKMSKFFSNINFMHQGSQFLTDPAQTKYDAAPREFWVNFRTKVELKVTDDISAFVHLSGNIKNDYLAGGGYDGSYLYQRLFDLPPTAYGPITSDGRITTMQNVSNPLYGLLNYSGFTSDAGLNLVAHAGTKYNLNFLTKGLSISTSIAFQVKSDRFQYATQDYERYYYDFAGGDFVKLGSSLNTPLVNSVSGNFQYDINYLAGINYKRDFGINSVELNGYSFFMKQMKPAGDPNVPAVNLPYYRHSLGANFAYGFNDTYFAKVDLGYSGSDQFSRAKRYIAVPSVSVAWVLSNEQFMKNFSWLSNLKIRASYGLSANDDFNSGGYRFLYMDYISPRGGELIKGNPDIHAERAECQNYGIDLGLFNQLSLSFDLFKKRTEDMLIDGGNILPGYQGIPIGNFAKTNNGISENEGFDLGIIYSKKFNKNISIKGSFNFTRAINKIIYMGELQLPGGTDGYAYRYRNTGYPVGQLFGLLIDKSNGSGYITNTTELAKYKAMYIAGGIGTPRLGDFIYQDLNGDNKIDNKDEAPVGSGYLPENYFSFQGNIIYKSFEFSMMFQGVTGYYSSLGLFTETAGNGIFNDLQMKAWTPDRFSNHEEIPYPALSYETNSPSMRENDFMVQDCSYLRLKNLTMGYTLPHSVSSLISAEKIQFTLSAQNLFTIDGLKTKNIDPETHNINQFQVYKVFNIGVKMDF